MRAVVHRTLQLIDLLWREIAKFGAVGGVGWVIDNGLYALLWHGPMSESTIKARIVSTTVATLFSWFANRYWTFRHRRSDRPWREFVLFLVMNGGGLGIVVLCQFVSRYVLGFTSFTADFIAGGVIGLILGMIFRFLAYRYFVFNQVLDQQPGVEHDLDIIDVGSFGSPGAPGTVQPRW
ncbi:GtrA family protein [uncultured Kocuria sp.]|uniref:GtrA family protein n=1 Tax=uncultured Kocuria sp. TaxID=259305 RepID=UPI0026375C2E|nr:GtrA family protein [uncultured Kocuria sp.]